MKSLTLWISCLGIIVGGLPILSFASPFLVSDPNPTALNGWAEISGADWAPQVSPVMDDGSIRIDMSNAPVGARSNFEVRVCIEDYPFEPLCSEWVPFEFMRRARPFAANGLKLVK